MLYPKIEDCIHRVGCKYTLTTMVAKRAKDLAQKMPDEFNGKGRKELSYALDEVADGKLAPYFSSGS